MAKPTVPTRFQLDLSFFPKDDLGQPVIWAAQLVGALNKFAVQAVAYLQQMEVTKTYKTLKFTTGSTVADSFPITLTLSTLPTEIRIAQVVQGTVSIANPVTLQWQFVNNATNNETKQVQITGITGLQASTFYELLLVLE